MPVTLIIIKFYVITTNFGISDGLVKLIPSVCDEAGEVTCVWLC